MGWIKVSEKLPNYCDEVLLYCLSLNSCVVGYLSECDLWTVCDWDESDTNYKLNEVDYWMPLPKYPKEIKIDFFQNMGKEYIASWENWERCERSSEIIAIEVFSSWLDRNLSLFPHVDH